MKVIITIYNEKLIQSINKARYHGKSMLCVQCISLENPLEVIQKLPHNQEWRRWDSKTSCKTLILMDC